ncbi:MAG: carboxypeptidase-like regulatory domain-containing protein [Flavobacterium sp.]|nr:carboxypeptidase-like regulatory domain-containing protein [Flavobacterium sp.]
MKTITGVISDSSGPLPGVNVVVKGTQRGVSTNFQGEYSIQAKEGESLVFSFMGMKDITKVVGSSTIMNAILNDSSKVLGGMVIVSDYEPFRNTKNHAMRNSEHKLEQHTFLGRQFHKIGSWFR